jgi:hypothetical protein
MALKFDVTVRNRTDEGSNFRDRAQRFWEPISRRYKDQNDGGIPALEAQLERDFPERLRYRLREQFAERSWRRDIFREWFPFPEKMFQEVAKELAKERVAQADRIEETVNKITFRTKIVGYSSMKLSVEAAPESALKELFGDVDAVELFLDAALPYCFGSTFTQEIADGLEFEVSARDGIRTSQVLATEAQASNAPRPSSDKFEKIWRIANFSLVLPVLLTIYIFFQGLRELADIRRMDDRQPLMELQMKMLQADTERMKIGVAPQPCPQTTTTTTANK